MPPYTYKDLSLQELRTREANLELKIEEDKQLHQDSAKRLGDNAMTLSEVKKAIAGKHFIEMNQTT